MMLLLDSSRLAAQPYLVGYWQNFTNAAGYQALDETDARYDVVNVAFAIPKAGTEYDMEFVPCCGTSQAEMITQIQGLQAAGKIVNISIGGATAPVKLLNATERDVFVSSMNVIMATYGFDGVDVDLEGSSMSVSASSSIANPTDATIINLIDAFETILADYQTANGKKMFLSTAPETAFVQGGLSNWGGIWGAYLPFIEALHDEWDLVHVQLYNSGTMFGLDGEIYGSETADFIVALTEAMIQGFTAVGNGGRFTGFSESVVAIGLPACPSAAGSGFATPATVTAAVKYLTGEGPQPEDYTLIGGPYPSLGGLMTWSINWDQSNCGNTTAVNEFASNYEALLGNSAECLTPDLGPDKSACKTGYPIVLDSNTPTAQNVTFTWKNLTTGTTLVTDGTTENTLSVNEAGAYQLTRDSLNGCSRVDLVVISEEIDAPQLEGDEVLCTTLPGSVTLSNAADYPLGTTFQWSFDGEQIDGATTPTLDDVRSAGIATVTATDGSCSVSADLSISSSLPNPVDICGLSGSTVDLAVTGGVGPFSWYAAPTGGSALATGATFTTPPLSQPETTYYVEDEGTVGTNITGPAVGDFADLQSYRSPDKTFFNVNEETVLNSIDVIPIIYCFEHNVTAEIRNAAGTVLGSASLLVMDDTDCATVYNTPVTLDFGGITLPAGNDYELVMTSATIGAWFYQGITFPLDYSPYITITRSDVAGRVPSFINWAVVGGNCARLPVVATSSDDCNTVSVSTATSGGTELFVIAPNPARGRITVSGLFADTVELFDVNGRSMRKWSATGSTLEMDLPVYAPGIYFIRAGAQVQRVVLK